MSAQHEPGAPDVAGTETPSDPSTQTEPETQTETDTTGETPTEASPETSPEASPETAETAETPVAPEVATEPAEQPAEQPAEPAAEQADPGTPAESPAAAERAVPVPPPAPGPTPAPPAPDAPAASTGQPAGGATPSDWGRVAEDGTVFLRTADGERSLGQYVAGGPDEAMAFYTGKFAELEFEVTLLEQRVRGGALSPDEAASSVRKVREQVVGAHAVGDLDSLVGRLDALAPVIGGQREARKAERAQRVAESKVAKDRIVSEAEGLAQGTDWRNGANRLRALLEEWKALPRLDRSSDDALWHRFSTARTAYTRRRKAHFAEQNQKRDAARVVKERLATEAESLAGSTEWGPTAGRFRDLMREWKAAGPAPRDVDDALWKRFRGAQDQFFGSRDAANAELDKEFAANAEVKEQLLEQAEALVPVTDLDAAKRSFRDIADKWDAAGKVPRDRMKELEGRIRRVEQAIRGVEDEQWRRSDPEKSARAGDMIAKLESAIADIEADLDTARAAGNEKVVRDLEENLASRQSFLEMARRASADFSG